MADFPAMPLWTDALIGDTTHLSTLEFGAYLKLLIACWRSPHCDLPLDEGLLRRYAGLLAPQWGHMRTIILAFFTIRETTKGPRIRQKRLRRERAYVLKSSKRQSRRRRGKSLKNNNTTLTADYPRNNLPTPTPTISKKDSPPPSVVPPAVAPPLASPTADRGSRLSDDWEPSAEDRSYALGHGLSEAEIDAAAEEFRNYWTSMPGQKGRKTRWDRTWQNRVKEVADRKAYRGNGNGRRNYVSPQAKLATEFFREMAEQPFILGIENTSRGDGGELSREVVNLRKRS